MTNFIKVFKKKHSEKRNIRIKWLNEICNLSPVDYRTMDELTICEKYMKKMILYYHDKLPVDEENMDYLHQNIDKIIDFIDNSLDEQSFDHKMVVKKLNDKKQLLIQNNNYEVELLRKKLLEVEGNREE